MLRVSLCPHGEPEEQADLGVHRLRRQSEHPNSNSGRSRLRGPVIISSVLGTMRVGGGVPETHSPLHSLPPGLKVLKVP